jgi:hypothetical protein
MTYKLERTDLDERWDEFVNTSPNGSIFSHSDYLKSINKKSALYFLLKNKELRASVAVVESDDGKSTTRHNFIIYNGVMFAPPRYKQNNAQTLSERFRITTFIAEELAKIYKNVYLTLHPSVTDIRPFLWFNYGTDKPKYATDIRFTSYVNIEDFAHVKSLEDTSLYPQTSSSRRQEIRYAVKEGVTTKEEYKADLFVDFYCKTMKRQDIEVEQLYLEEMKTIITNLYKAKLGRLFVSYTKSGEAGSMAFFGIDGDRAYYIFGANEPGLRDSHTGTAVLWDGFYYLSKNGVKEVDLEGINSPKRGWFKLSFGGNIVPYFQLFFHQ